MRKIEQHQTMDILAEEMVFNNIGSEQISRSLKEYKETVNMNAKVFSIDLGGYNKILNSGEEFNQDEYIKIPQEQVMRY